MRKILPSLLLLFLGIQHLSAQCDAAFTYTINQNQVHFVSTDSGRNLKHTWFFGEGAVDFYSSQPVHNYSMPGQYSVLHSVRDSVNNCIDSAWQVINLDFTPTCSVNFTYINVPGTANEYVFYPQVNIVGSSLQQIKWSVNGVQASTKEVFKTNFTNAASYRVCVTIESASGCTAQKCQVITFTPFTRCSDNSNFTYSIDSAQPQHVNFTATPNQPQLKHYWYFGDGGTGWGSTESHTYADAGTYIATLIVKDSIRHCMDSISKTITIAAPVSKACTTSFTHTVNQQGQVAFTAISKQPIVSQTWTIVSADSAYHRVLNDFNPVYSFPDSGLYYVCLSILTDTGCRASYCDTIQINPSVPSPTPHCADTARFTYTVDSVQTRMVHFTAMANSPYATYHWSFGDGSAGSTRLVSHLYAREGTYTVKLVVKDSVNNCADSVSKVVQVNPAGSETCTASFTYIINQYGQASFTAISNQSITSQTWTIFSPDSLHNTVLPTTNPVYNFSDTGSYYVCVAVVTDSGCVARHCETIRINSVGAGRPALIASYPNPVSGESTVRLNIELKQAGIISYKVYNLAGTIAYQTQQQGQQGNNSISIPVQQLMKGQYFVDIIVGGQRKRSVFQKL